ncbi:helix-turn-helix domain-containing protein [Halomarina litorea]|uniref:helix-turn-helix domain-containing protein n=1 Tax=Halomarina litorea TaxID=2961595 RepID=UPI0020C56E1C|nr:helix-turn-helix domain-containing protein [Halomarina sp. BCD28]
MSERAGGVAAESGVDVGPEDAGGALPDEASAVDPSEAFAPLGNETRVRVLAALLSPEGEEGVGNEVAPRTRTFSELFEASGADTTAGFAYHLRQLTDHYLREVEGGYTFTDAGLRVARAIVSGAYTDSVDRDPVPVGDPCPFCDGETLVAGAADNTVAVSCTACERDVLSLSFPPGGHRSHDDDSLPAAFDRLHRHRVALMTRGSCPECGGASDSRVEYAREEGDEMDDDADPSRPVRLELECAACGYAMRCPVTLAVLDHPAVVSFYHDHSVDVRERPIWNVGPEWTEGVLSDDPWCVRVATELDGDGLELLVGADGSVVEYEEYAAGTAS